MQWRERGSSEGLSAWSFWESVRQQQPENVPELTAEKELLVAVLYRTAQDLYLPDDFVRLDAKRWVMRDDHTITEHGWSFVAVCEYLDLDPGRTREWIFKIPPEKIGKGRVVRRVEPRNRRR